MHMYWKAPPEVEKPECNTSQQVQNAHVFKKHLLETKKTEYIINGEKNKAWKLMVVNLGEKNPSMKINGG